MQRLRSAKSLAAIALQRCSEQELRMLHETISDLSPVAFIELIRDIEDEIESSLTMTWQRVSDEPHLGYGSNELYSDLERIRRKDLRIPVQRFADLLAESLKENPSIDVASFPNFESRRGLQAWINRLIRTYSEQLVYKAAIELRSKIGKGEGSAWKLR